MSRLSRQDVWLGGEMDRGCDIRCSFAISNADKCHCKCGGEGHGLGWARLKERKEGDDGSDRHAEDVN